MAWQAKVDEKRRIDFKRRKYSEAVRKNFVPAASEQKHNELINAMANQEAPMSKGQGHVSSEFFVSRNNSVAVPKSY